MEWLASEAGVAAVIAVVSVLAGGCWRIIVLASEHKALRRDFDEHVVAQDKRDQRWDIQHDRMAEDINIIARDMVRRDELTAGIGGINLRLDKILDMRAKE